MSGRQALKYGAVLIGLYLITVRATGAGQLVKASTDGAGNLVAKLQGR